LKYKDYPESASPTVITSKQVVNDYQCIPAPGNPPTGNVRVYCDSGTGLFTCLTSSGSSCSSTSSPGGSNTQVQFNDSSAFGGSARLTFDKVTGQFVSTSTSAALTSITSGTGQGNGLQIIGNSGVNLKAEEAGGQLFLYTTSGDINLNPGAGKDVVVGGPSQGNSGAFKFVGTTSGLARFGVADTAGTPNRVNIPSVTGSSGQFLQTDGGNPQQTSWATPTLATTATNCSNAASPAACGSAQAGSVVIAAGASTVTVTSTAVTANSQVLVFPDEALGTKLSVTCNSTLATAASGLAITARMAATSFQISTVATIAVNPVCLSYLIIN